MAVFMDISRPVGPDTPVWPGDPPVLVEALTRIVDGDPADVSRLQLGTHTGTHVDPPAHFLPGGATVDALPLDVLVGPAWVADQRGTARIDAEELRAAGIPDGTERLLLRTGPWNGDAGNGDAGNGDAGSGEVATTSAGAPNGSPAATNGALTADGARWVVERGVRLVGVDTLSIEPETDTYPVHRILLEAGVVIVEALDLSDVAAGQYQLVCLPLRITSGDGAPARAILIAE